MSGGDGLKTRLRAASDDVLIIAHRGVWEPLPENSIPAIAAASIFDIVEIDVQLTADKGLVVHHDETFTRMVGDGRALCETTVAEITAMILRGADGGDQAPLTDHNIPDLAAALRAAPDTIFDLDAKNAEETRAVAEAAAALGAADHAAVKVDVASLDDLAALLALQQDTGLMVAAKIDLVDEASLDLIDAARDADVALTEVWFDELEVLSQATHRAGPGMRLSTYTLDPVHCCGLNDETARRDPAAVWGVLIDAGIGAIMTDEPAALRAYLAAR